MRATKALYSAILDLPDSDAAGILRFMLKG